MSGEFSLCVLFGDASCTAAFLCFSAGFFYSSPGEPIFERGGGLCGERAKKEISLIIKIARYYVLIGLIADMQEGCGVVDHNTYRCSSQKSQIGLLPKQRSEHFPLLIFRYAAFQCSMNRK